MLRHLPEAGRTRPPHKVLAQENFVGPADPEVDESQNEFSSEANDPFWFAARGLRFSSNRRVLPSAEASIA